MRAFVLALALGMVGAMGCSSNDSASGGSGAPEPFTPKPKPKVGAINLFVGQSPTASPGTGGRAFSIAGYFLDYSGIANAPDGISYAGVRATECTKRTAGDCEVVRCKATKDDGFQPGVPKYTSAGEISAKAGALELKSTPNEASSNAYLGEVPASDALGVGASVVVTASGGEVPAFTETLAFGAPITLKSSAQMSVAKGTDARIEWDGGQGPVTVSGSGSSAGDFIVNLSCTFATKGGGTIPGTLLGDDVAGQKLSLGLYATQITKTVGEYEVALNAMVSDNGLGGGNVELEVK